MVFFFFFYISISNREVQRYSTRIPVCICFQLAFKLRNYQCFATTGRHFSIIRVHSALALEYRDSTIGDARRARYAEYSWRKKRTEGKLRRGITVANGTDGEYNGGRVVPGDYFGRI